MLKLSNVLISSILFVFGIILVIVLCEYIRGIWVSLFAIINPSEQNNVLFYNGENIRVITCDGNDRSRDVASKSMSSESE